MTGQLNRCSTDSEKSVILASYLEQLQDDIEKKMQVCDAYKKTIQMFYTTTTTTTTINK